MKRALLPALLLALLVAVPALSQGTSEKDSLAKDVAKLKEQVTKQDALLKELQEYRAKQMSEAAALVRALRDAEAGGFLYPAPNTDARKVLLTGLARFATVVAGGTPAPTTEAAPK